MNRLLIVPVALVAAAGLGFGGFLVFEHFEQGDLVKAAEQSCAPLDAPAMGTPTTLPLGLPRTAGSTVLMVGAQGKTTIATAVLAGHRTDIVTVRDQVLSDLKSAGYTVTGTDAEPGFEAEAEVDGAHHGTVRVKPLCSGKLSITYKIEQ